MIYVLPIEPFEERYSIQWYEWFHRYLSTENVEFLFIDGELLTKEITTGSFLDVCGTNYYKSSQLMQISELIHRGKIKDGDAFLFHDGWFPGIESLAYMRDGLGINFKIYGIFHAGSYDSQDFLSHKGMGHWAEDLENSWFKIFDGVFVATEFHKKLILRKRKIASKKIHVTFFPIYDDFVVPLQKENLIVFPHRIDTEKQPELFDTITLPDSWNKFRTKDTYVDKKTYYRDLCKARIAVSFALQETWGICMQEAVFCGCIPLVPNRLSYPEQYPQIFIYNSLEEFHSKLAYLIENWNSKEIVSFQEETKKSLLRRGGIAIENMVKVIECEHI